jgi:DNA replication protein DnaC
MQLAKFPVLKTLDQYNFEHPQRLPKKLVLSLFDLSFVKNKRNVLFIGQPGLGKTHLAIALGYQACQKGVPTLFTTAAALINHLNAALSDNSFLEALKKYLKPRLLILDELGFLPIDKRGSDLLFQVASARYETGAMVIPGLPRALAGQARPIARRTSGTKFSTTIPSLACGRAGLAAALADRVLHHCEVVVIEGQSYRVKNNKSQS